MKLYAVATIVWSKAIKKTLSTGCSEAPAGGFGTERSREFGGDREGKNQEESVAVREVKGAGRGRELTHRGATKGRKGAQERQRQSAR